APAAGPLAVPPVPGQPARQALGHPPGCGQKKGMGVASPRHAEALQRFAQRVHVRAALPAIEQVLDEIKHRLVVGVRARKAQRLVQRAELLTAATARAPAGAQEPLALGGGVGPEGLAQLGQPPDGARALENTACLAHARFTLCGRCRASSSWRAPTPHANPSSFLTPPTAGTSAL